MSVTMRQMLEAGVHFGHQTRYWNPKMAPYLYGTRMGIHIFELSKTREYLERVCAALKKLQAEGKTILFVTHDIDEALFLADRVLVMSHRPGRIIEEIKVPFARPRSAEVSVTPEFGELKRRCLSLLHTPSSEDALPRLEPLGIRNVS